MTGNVSFNDILFGLLNSKYDELSTKDEEYAKQLQSIHTENVERNKRLTTLLKEYAEQRNTRAHNNHILKNVIFWTFLTLLFALTVVVLIVFLRIDFNNIDVSSIVGLLSVVVTYIGSLLAVFEIMSRYLFPIDEEKDTTDMIKTVIDNDVKTEELLGKSMGNQWEKMAAVLQSYKELLDSQVITQEEYDKIKQKVIK